MGQPLRRAAGFTVDLTILPFHDPGEEVRQGALREYESAKTDLDTAAHDCATEVKAGCADAPEKRTWYEKVGGAVAGFFAGAGEALVDLGKMAYFLAMPHVAIPMMLMDDLDSGMTPEEIAAKYELKLEDAKAIGEYAVNDPVGFGKTLGKSILDWDTWADDPARAAGRLLPDAVIAVLTAGSGTVATRGAAATRNAVEGLDKLDDLAGLRHVDGLPGEGRGAPDAPGSPSGADSGGRSSPSLSEIDGWLNEINGSDKIDWSDPGENCGKCALAVHERLEGSTTSKAGTGTLSVPEMEAATGRTQVPMAPDDIAKHLQQQGTGSHAVVGIDRANGPGHWFNAYYDGNKVVAVDGQTGEILDWPPDMGNVTNWDVGVEKPDPPTNHPGAKPDGTDTPDTDGGTK